MSDFKSPFIALIPARAALPELEGSVFCPAITDLLEAAQGSGHARSFPSDGYDHLRFLDPLLLGYGGRALARLREIREAEDGSVSLLPFPRLGAMRAEIERFEAGFLGDPGRAAQIIARPEADAALMLALWQGNEGRGYLPGAYPQSLEVLSDARADFTLQALFQSFGYLKALSGWCREAETEGRAILEILW